ncbi:hypothetical protein ACJ51O_30985 [Burkholderia pyrrocinia]|uniref:hypothetical protein n=1 Tax=Burkholderia TaxID=32008 RepID=UPI001C2F7EF8|nr:MULTISPECIES: hypothetical protein [Burkholderia]UOB59703.1 hypothetical protein MRS60_23445 [Burkholderia pyrrocinia]
MAPEDRPGEAEREVAPGPAFHGRVMIERSKQACAAELKRFRVNGNVWIAADEMRTGVDVPMTWRGIAERT